MSHFLSRLAVLILTGSSLLASGSVFAEGGVPGGAALAEFLPLVLLVVVFYFFLIRPQNKKTKEHRTLVSELSKGDEVVTAGGIIGKVTKVSDDYIAVQTGNDVELSFQKVAVTAVLPKGTVKELNK